VSRSYRTGVESSLSWAYVVLNLVFATSWVMVGAADRARVGPGLRAAICAFAVLALSEVWRGARRRLADVDVTAVTLVAIWLQLAWANEPQSPFGPGQRTMVTTAVVFGASMFATRRVRVTALVSAVGAQLAADWVRTDLLTALTGLLPVATAGLVVAVCIPVMREAARRADGAADGQHRSAARAAERAASSRAHLEIQGVLHDDVVSALRAVSLTDVSAAEARSAAQGAIAAIERSPVDEDATPRDLVQLVNGLEPVPGTVTTFRLGDELIVPAAVARASVAAAREALRNVARHARASHVLVSLDRVDDGFTLAISDDGIGFRTPAGVGRSHGLRYSVIRRIEDVGGQADVISATGRGTVVRLAWQPVGGPPPHDPSRPERIASALVDVRRPLAAVCLPYLTMTGAYALRYTIDGSAPWWLLVWFAGLGAITLALLARAHTGLSGPVVAAALGYGVAGTIASLFVLSPGSAHDYSSWPLGAITALLAVVVIVRPPWEAAAALLVQQVAITAAALTGRFGSGPWTAQIAAVTPGAMSTVEPVVLGLVVVQVVLKLGDAVMRANAAYDAATAAESALRAREATYRHRLVDMNEEILPFLREVATAGTCTVTADLRVRARALEHAARDELHIPGVLDAAARELVRRARDAGSVITIQSGDDLERPDLVRALLVTALTAGAPPRELVLSLQGGGVTTLNLVTIPGDPERAGALDREFGPLLNVLDANAEATWAEIALPVRLPAADDVGARAGTTAHRRAFDRT
jgi:hypothetical protein